MTNIRYQVSYMMVRIITRTSWGRSVIVTWVELWVMPWTKEAFWVTNSEKLSLLLLSSLAFAILWENLISPIFGGWSWMQTRILSFIKTREIDCENICAKRARSAVSWYVQLMKLINQYFRVIFFRWKVLLRVPSKVLWAGIRDSCGYRRKTVKILIACVQGLSVFPVNI